MSVVQIMQRRTLFWSVMLSCWAVLFCHQVHAFDKKALCSGVFHCLSEKPALCAESACDPDPDIDYDEAFCAVFHELKKRGLEPDTQWGRRIYSYVSRPHRITYTVEDTLPVPAPVMRYLMDNPSFAAQLVNAYQGTSYSVVYTDKRKRRIRGDNGRDLSGEFSIVLQDAEHFRTVYFGYGIVQILMWHLYGNALVLFDYAPVDRDRITYRLSCMVFPANAFIRSILDFVMFRSAVVRILRENVDYVHLSAGAFYSGNRKPVEDYPGLHTPEGIRSIERLKSIWNTATAGTP